MHFCLYCIIVIKSTVQKKHKILLFFFLNYNSLQSSKGQSLRGKVQYVDSAVGKLDSRDF